jgi:hypothetical protein
MPEPFLSDLRMDPGEPELRRVVCPALFLFS